VALPILPRCNSDCRREAMLRPAPLQLPNQHPIAALFCIRNSDRVAFGQFEGIGAL
jgi:hypothetical protein